MHLRWLVLCLPLAFGCHGRVRGPTVRPLTKAPPVRFVEVSERLGIRFQHHSGARGKKYMPETVGSGCAFIDYDQDGRLDLLFMNGTDWPGAAAQPHYPALYRNLGDSQWEDVTRRAGLALDMYGMGACVGDYDNDGDPDLFLTCLGPNRLFRNNGDATFTEVTATAGVAGRPVEPGGLRWKWSSSAAWLDYDRDGRLDLFVCNYVKWTPETDVFCGQNKIKAYCAPNNFEGVPSLLYHNRGGGRFQDVSDEAGIFEQVGKSFGVAVADFNNDHWPDLAVANDTKENFLFLNHEGKRFEERALEGGFALSPAGVVRAGMGIDAADWDHSGQFGLVVGNFSRECLGLYRNNGQAVFEEVAFSTNLAEPSLMSLTFGVFFFDFNLDGYQDVFAANGHIDDVIQTKDAVLSYEQLPLLLQGHATKKFTEVGAQSGPALARKRVLRGCARGDFDNDGDPDIAVVGNNRRGELWRNEGGNAHRWLGFVLRGIDSNRDGLGAFVKVEAGTLRQTVYRHSGGSFLAESDPRLVVGLGTVPNAQRVEVVWPSGRKQVFRDVPAGRYYEMFEDGRLIPCAVEEGRLLRGSTPEIPSSKE